MVAKLTMFAVSTLVVVIAGVGCSSNDVPRSSQDGSAQAGAAEFGGVSLKLTVPVNFQVNSVHYDIVDQATGQVVVAKDADVSSADAIARAFVLLPPGSYVANLSATGSQPCSGSTSVFTVTPNSNQSVQAGLTCGTVQAVVHGVVVLDATFVQANTCGITRLFAGPLVQGAGKDITLSGTATPAASYLWTSTASGAGSLNNATSANASFTCSGAGGVTTLTLRIQDLANPNCTATQSVDVICATPGECGDGVLSPGEGCEDGNNLSNDGCSNTCQLEICGDGIVQPGLGEECEASSTPNCNPTTCRPYECGDLILDPGEACDGGPLCTPTCTLITCGNGQLDPGEECDDGNTVDTDRCNNLCRIDVLCGDGLVDPPEVCDTAVDPLCASDCLSVNQPPFGCLGATGQACQAANCSYELAQCNTPECVALQDCIYQTGCVYTSATPPLVSSLDACFCGIGADINACYISGQPATGPCVSQFLAAAVPNTTNSSIGPIFYDASYPVGAAGLLQYCQQTLCATECGY